MKRIDRNMHLWHATGLVVSKKTKSMISSAAGIGVALLEIASDALLAVGQPCFAGNFAASPFAKATSLCSAATMSCMNGP